MSGQDNNAFDMSENPPIARSPAKLDPSEQTNKAQLKLSEKATLNGINGVNDKKADPEKSEPEKKRAVWDNQVEFLMSCISISVGLGNVWRFPFVAYENGGGAFIIPYIIVLLLIGKPMYYLECAVGQFASRNSVSVWSLNPAMKGAGYATALGCGYILSYYVSIVALCMYYLAMSFQPTLPWGVCLSEWRNCVPSDPSQPAAEPIGVPVSSAELYFTQTVLQQKKGIEGGLGLPIWYLTLCLFASWFIVFCIVARGVKSSGKAAYFLALFPYIVMIILLITTVILPGAGEGILFFLTPQWDKLIELDVWYAAVTQVFFSLSVCTGAIIMFSSYNGFRQNVYRDAMIVTTLDTITSLLSGITIFGILGNLAYELKQDISGVIGSGGTGLAFVSYPDAISKTFQPQLFAVLFFLMMTVLGIGSSVALLSTINTVMLDAFPRVRTVFMSAFCCTIGFAIGLIYVTPGGQYILTLVDHFGGTFLILFCAIVEVIGIVWIYGLEKLCVDMEYMLGIKTGFYWRFCWGIVTPAMMTTVFIYALITSEDLTFGDDYIYPTAGYVSGYLMLIIGIAFVPISITLTLFKYRSGNFMQTVKRAFSPKPSWGPRAAHEKLGWQQFTVQANEERDKLSPSLPRHIWYILTGGYRRRL